jgi:hypothetical protein
LSSKPHAFLTIYVVLLLLCCALVVLLSQELSRFSSSVNAATRQVSCWLLGEFAGYSTADFDQYIPMIIKDLIQKFHDEDAGVLAAAVAALDKVRYCHRLNRCR